MLETAVIPVALQRTELQCECVYLPDIFNR